MTNNIVKRLRARADEQERNDSYPADRAMDREAADEIERLRAEYPYSGLDLDMHVEAVTKELRAEIERLRTISERVGAGKNKYRILLKQKT